MIKILILPFIALTLSLSALAKGTDPSRKIDILKEENEPNLRRVGLEKKPSVVSAALDVYNSPESARERATPAPSLERHPPNSETVQPTSGSGSSESDN